jgi:hypothetical protein
MINAEAVRRRDAEIIESLYEDALFYELRVRNIPALSQVQIPVSKIFRQYVYIRSQNFRKKMPKRAIFSSKASFERSLLCLIHVLSAILWSLLLVFGFDNDGLIMGKSRSGSSLQLLPVAAV